MKKNKVWERIKKVAHFVTTVLTYAVFLILVLVGIMLVMYFIDLKKNAAAGVYKPPLFSAYVIVSPSMVPTINVEDAIVVKRVEPDQIKKNDIITFVSTDNRYSGITVTHRVVGIVKNDKGELLFRTKGDNNNTEDSTLVGAGYINGKVILRIPKIGYIQYFLSQSYGWIIAIVIPCMGIVIYDVLKLVKLIKNNVVKKTDKDKDKSKMKSKEKR